MPRVNRSDHLAWRSDPVTREYLGRLRKFIAEGFDDLTFGRDPLQDAAVGGAKRAYENVYELFTLGDEDEGEAAGLLRLP